MVPDMQHGQGRQSTCNDRHVQRKIARRSDPRHRRALRPCIQSRRIGHIGAGLRARLIWQRAFAHLVRVFLLIAILATIATHQAVAAEAPPDTSPVSVLALPAGQSLLMRYPNPKRVAAGDGAIIDVRVFDDTQEILVLGKQEGVTDLRIWGRDGSQIAYLVKVLGIPEPERIPDQLEAQSTILIKAKLIEVKRSALRNIGIDWADVAAGPIFGMLDEFVTNEHFRVLPEGTEALHGLPLNLGTNNHYFAMTTIVDSVINLLVNNGDARLLAEPTLTCISGGQADFLVGGEVPIPVQNQDGALNVIFKQFGIILKI